MDESKDFPQSPPEADTVEIQRAYKNAVTAYSMAKDKLPSRPSKDEIVNEARIVKASLGKIRVEVLRMYGPHSLDYVNWSNLGIQATVEDKDDRESIWYLPKKHILIKAPEKREKIDGVYFDILVPSVKDKPKEADEAEWILKGKEIAQVLQRLATTKPPMPTQTVLKL